MSELPQAKKMREVSLAALKTLPLPQRICDSIRNCIETAAGTGATKTNYTLSPDEYEFQDVIRAHLQERGYSAFYLALDPPSFSIDW